ncbi:major tail protein [Enterococcus phage Entf1]|uniref:Major tail protein n=2 Tax=Saphexavirus TaxID=1623302 RepID=S5MX54_9CAUD|nr:major tail protein [Enterococcus phage IMEEF1]AGR49077.1 major tail protein [Enterococcus phage IMEEF1]QDB70495.1 major tail protein [Enterococcus phage Entf1]QYI86600.1 tail tube protein [Enterococcus phage SSsP-1]
MEACKSSYIRGTAVLIEVQNDLGEWIKVAAQRGGTLNRTAATLDVSNKEGFGWDDAEAGNKSWSIDCDGLFVEDNAGFQALNAAWVNGDCVRVRVKFPSGLTYVGQAILTDFPYEFGYEDAVTYSLTFQGKGALEEQQVAPTILPKKIEFNMVTKEVKVGETLQAVVKFTPENVSDKSVTYTALTPALATIDEAGLITGVKEGTASFNVRSNVNTAISALVDIEVKPAGE